jgi:hypothetical protein
MPYYVVTSHSAGDDTRAVCPTVLATLIFRTNEGKKEKMANDDKKKQKEKTKSVRL